MVSICYNWILPYTNVSSYSKLIKKNTFIIDKLWQNSKNESKGVDTLLRIQVGGYSKYQNKYAYYANAFLISYNFFTRKIGRAVNLIH